MSIEATALIVVTAFINLAVSNFIFYRYQKNIESSYAKQLEEFKASLNRLNFEYQTMLSRKLPKRLEVLETICQKYVNIVSKYSDLVEHLADYAISHSNEHKEIMNQKKLIYYESTREIKEYYQTNRLLLSEESIEIISNVLDATESIIYAINNIVDISPKNRRQRIELANSINRRHKLDFVFINPDEDDSEISYLYSLEKVFNKMSLRLEQHYKSIVGE